MSEHLAPPARPAGLTPSNWIDAPYNRWGFWHVRQMAKTARISRGSGPVTPLPAALRPLDTMHITHKGAHIDWANYLQATYTDAMVVLHQGNLAYEWYAPGYGPADTHLLMSCSKSLTATHFGQWVSQGRINTLAMVTDYIPRLRGTAWEGCSVQSVLDMRAGVQFDESNYDDPLSDVRLSEEVFGYRPRVHSNLPTDTADWIHTVAKTREHGEGFEYQSLLTCVLAWIIQEVSGVHFASTFSRDLWAAIGAERDADLIVDDAGFPIVEGGLCTTARDFARFGLMCLQKGQINGQQIMPATWFERLHTRNPALVAAYNATQKPLTAFPHSYYHDQWWVIDPDQGIYSGRGINGQQLFIHTPSQTVIAKFSTWPTAKTATSLQDAGLFAVCDYLQHKA